LVSFHAQVSPLTPGDDAQSIHLIGLTKQLIMVSIRTIHTQLSVFQCAVPGIKGAQSRLFTRCKQIFERIHLIRPPGYLLVERSAKDRFTTSDEAAVLNPGTAGHCHRSGMDQNLLLPKFAPIGSLNL
jgi:hypothetical protein